MKNQIILYGLLFVLIGLSAYGIVTTQNTQAELTDMIIHLESGMHEINDDITEMTNHCKERGDNIGSGETISMNGESIGEMSPEMHETYR